ncbi:MAG TPA: ATP-binding protein [Kineosporiaceae bacterium]|nr:ATP-binding protein [Kineosporiaceae bacterium]
MTQEEKDHRPVAVLLYGLPGSGKSTYARHLAARGLVRLSVDDLMRRRHGRAGVDYPLDRHLDLLGPVVDDVYRQLASLLATGRSVVLDHGLGRRCERDAVKRVVEEHGGHWRLVVFEADRPELVRRLAARRPEDGFGPMSAEVLDAIARTSEEPRGEGEEAATW